MRDRVGEDGDLDGLSRDVAVLSREDIILHKVFAERLIDQADVMQMMETHWSELDQDYLQEWARNLEATEMLEDAIKRYRDSHR